MVSDLQKCCETITKSENITHTQFPLLLISYISIIFVTTNEPTLIHYYSLKVMLFADFLFFTSCSFSDPGQQHCLLRLLLVVTVAQTPLVFEDLDSFEEYWSQICRTSLSWDLSHFSRDYGITLKLWVWGRNTPEVKCHFRHAISSRSTTVTCHCVVIKRAQLAQMVLVNSFPLSHTVLFGGSYPANPTLGEWQG